MLLLADGARLFEPARDAAIEFIFTMGQASNSHSIVDCLPHFGYFQSGRGLAGSSADFTDCSDYFSAPRFPQSAMRNPQFSGL
jgi:hypothetical protein